MCHVRHAVATAVQRGWVRLGTPVTWGLIAWIWRCRRSHRALAHLLLHQPMRHRCWHSGVVAKVTIGCAVMRLWYGGDVQNGVQEAGW